MDSYNGQAEGQTISEADQEDNFKPVYKKYKRRDQPLDITEVLDFNKLENVSSSSVKRLEPVVPSLQPVVGLKPAEEWSIFQLLDHPGFYIIQNPFVAGSQRYWTSRCLQDLPRPPHATNLVVHRDIDPNTVWDSFLQDFTQRGSEAFGSSCPLRKLRWTTLGYHYHWTEKEYKADDHTPFPADLEVLSHYVACVMGFPEFRAEAGVVNYYHPDSALGPHTDHSELDHQAPLISFSFGQHAVFLMGGLTKAQTPTAVRLHSGDICIMSGEARLAYHAVPRILPSPHPPSTPPPCFHVSPGDWKMVDKGAGDSIPEWDKDQQETSKDQGAVSDSCSGFHEVTKSSSGERDSTKPFIVDSCHVSNAENVTEGTFEGNCSGKHDISASSVQHTNSSTQGGNSDNVSSSVYGSTTPKLQTTTPSAQSDSHTTAENNVFNDSATQLVKNGSTELSERDSPTKEYEDRVKAVNRQIVKTLQNQDWAPFALYLSSSRLNVNIRQVLKAGHTFEDAEVRQ